MNFTYAPKGRAVRATKIEEKEPEVPEEEEPADLYSEGHFCGNCGSFMDERVRYCGECGGKNQ